MFKITAKLQRNILLCDIDTDLRFREGDKLTLLLTNGGKVFERVEMQKFAYNYSWRLPVSGLWRVCAEYEGERGRAVSKTAPLQYVSAEDEEAFRRFLREDGSAADGRPVRYFRQEYPYADFAVLVGASVPAAHPFWKTVKLRAGTLEAEKDGVAAQLVSGAPLREWGLLSGEAVVNGTFLFGQEDAERAAGFSSSELLNAVGQYTCIVRGRGKTTLCTDYHGANKLFYYQKDGVFIAANKYHLLLLILRALSLPLELDCGLVASHCVALSSLFTQQPYARELFVKNTFLLPVQETIVFEKGAVRFGEAAIHADSRGCLSMSEETYREYLYKARDELLANFAAVMNNPRFDQAVIDLSGGLDSRVVLALAMRCRGKKKFRLFSYGSPREKECVESMVKALHLEYDPAFFRINWYNAETQPDTLTMSVKDYYDLRLSENLACYFDADSLLGQPCTALRRTIHLTGGGSEGILRNYITTAHVLAPSLIGGSVGETLRRYAGSDAYQNGMTMGGGQDDVLFRRLEQSIESYPFEELFQKFECFINESRNRFHFDVSSASSYRTPRYTPCLSKYAYLALVGTLPRFRNDRFYFDLLYALDPAVATFEYVAEENNAARLAYADELLFRDETLKTMLIPRSSGCEEWNKSYRRAMDGRYTHSPAQEEKIGERKAEWGTMRDDIEHVYALLTGYFKDVLRRNEELCRGIGLPMWLLLKDFRADDRSRLPSVLRMFRLFGSLYAIMHVGQNEKEALDKSDFCIEYGYEDFKD